MGIFSRIGEIVNANISSMLDKAEDPEKMVRLMIHEMEDTLTEVKSSAAEVIAERIRVERTLRQTRSHAETWEKKAALAVEKGRDDLAREALERKLLYSEEAQHAESRLKEADELVKQYQTDIARLEDKLQSAYRRQKELVAKQKRAQNRKRLEDKIYEVNTSGAFAKFEQYADSVDRWNAEADVQAASNESLEKKFAELESSGEVEEELAKLKQKAGKKS